MERSGDNNDRRHGLEKGSKMCPEIYQRALPVELVEVSSIGETPIRPPHQRDSNVSEILTDHSGSILRVQLNCPARTNAMILSMSVADAIAGVVPAPLPPDDTVVKHEITEQAFRDDGAVCRTDQRPA
jgi:hypothetical protein